MVYKEDPSLIHFALCFPDTYEIGMSHLGIQILYDLLNKREDTFAERFFAPWQDMELQLRNSNQLLSSLESGKALKDFDIAGFSLQHELTYTNILSMLDLGGIPLRACDRNENSPIVIAGGPCTVNPMPILPFFDAILIGDGEEAVTELIEVYKVYKNNQSCRHEILKAISKIEGFLVPSIHSAHEKGSLPVVKRRYISDINKFPFPAKVVVPHGEIIHDRYSIEIQRGCGAGCRFCQAGYIYRPSRQRKADDILDSINKAMQYTGWDETGLLSLNSGEYPHIIKIIDTLAEGGIKVSLPSLKVKSITESLLNSLNESSKRGFTIAPEAGSQRLRDFINKQIRNEDIFNAVEALFKNGWNLVKLYFMIGLPTETIEDVEEIVRCVKSIEKIANRYSQRAKIHVSVSTFIPKPHTPFQWCPMEREEIILKKQSLLRKGLKSKKINFHYHDIKQTKIEASISRGDLKTSQAIENAYKNGCRFDGWSERFSYEKWEKAFIENCIDLERLFAAPSLDAILPWDTVDICISKRNLLQEWNNACSGITTPECGTDSCSGCGSFAIGCRSGDFVSPPPTILSIKPLINKPKRYRLIYSRDEPIHLLSNFEMRDTLLRSIRRAGFVLSNTNGFHLLPRIDMGPACPVGVKGTNEMMDFIHISDIMPNEGLSKINVSLPNGIKVISLFEVGLDEPSLCETIDTWTYEITYVLQPFTEERINNFLKEEKVFYEIQLRDGIKRIELRKRVIEIKIAHDHRLLISITGGGGLSVIKYLLGEDILYKADVLRYPIILKGEIECQNVRRAQKR